MNIQLCAYTLLAEVLTTGEFARLIGDECVPPPPINGDELTTGRVLGMIGFLGEDVIPGHESDTDNCGAGKDGCVVTAAAAVTGVEC